MFRFWQALMITERMVGGPAYLKAIEEIDGEFTKVIEDFVRAVDVESLRLIKRTGTHSLSTCGVIVFSVTSCRPKRARARGARAFDSTA